MTGVLLAVEGLVVRAGVPPVDLVAGLDLMLRPGESLGLVGESGCGKSLTALAIMGLLADGLSASGSIRFEGAQLIGQSDRALSRIRGRRMAMIFQEPMTALNPVRTIGHQVAEGPRRHLGLSARAGRERARELLDRVGLPQARVPLDAYPHQLSGGQRQRVLIAIALACQPALLIADEPTTALDVTVQAHILDLIAALCAAEGAALLMITHDLGVVAEMTDRVTVMYAGRAVEEGPTEKVFARRAHPYTQGLFAARPQAEAAPGGRLPAIPGQVPDPRARPQGCFYRGRCALERAACAAPPPWRHPAGADHRALCVAVGEAP